MSRAFITVKSQDCVSLLRRPSAAQVILWECPDRYSTDPIGDTAKR